MTVTTFLALWFLVAVVLAPFVGRMLRTSRKRTTYTPEEREEWRSKVEGSLR